MPIRVCVLTSVHQPFDGRIFYRECQALAHTGYQVTLIAPSDFERQEKDGVTVLGMPRSASRRQRPLVWWHLYRQVLYLRPDVVHLHDPELLLLVPLLRLALGPRIRIIYDVHEYFADSLANKYWIPHRLRPSAVVLARWAERLLIRGVDGIICVVEGQKPLYSGFHGPMAVVRNLPLASLFENPRPHPALDVDGFKLIYVGLILPKRGINVLLETMRLLRQHGVEDVYLFLIGPDTSPAYIQEIQTFAQTHQLAKHIRWLGPIPHHLLKHYLSSADVGLAPGLHTRQYSNPGLTTKLFEYMLCGLPIISADYPHRRVYIEEGNCGLVVSAEDTKAHAEAILWLRDHLDTSRAMGQRGRALVLNHYTWEQEQSHLLAFYQEILQTERPK